MAQGRQLDRSALHRLLWERASGRRKLVEVHQLTLADELNVNNSTLSAALRDLRESGKVRRIRTLQGNVGVYFVREPEVA